MLCRLFRCVLLALWMMATVSIVLAQQPITFQYFYDETGQLTRVVDSTEVVIEYVYDGVGNMLQVNRSTLSNPGGLSIFSFSPQQGGPLCPVTIQGQGFSTTAVNNVVRFNGTGATVISATANSLLVSVPVTATSGPFRLPLPGPRCRRPRISRPSHFR